ncbi:YhdP family protein [Rhodanobacter sp. BL-MT-08]
MKALWHRRLHGCARAVGWIGGSAVILLAVVMALTQLLLPLLAQHPEWVAAQLSERLQRPVSFASMEGRWTPSGPLFVMHGVTVGAQNGRAGAPLQVPESELKLDFGGWLAPSRHLVNLHVRGLELDLVRGADGGWHVNGIGVAGGKSKQPLSLGPLSMDLWLENLRVVISDAQPGKNYTLLAPQLRLSRQGDHIRFGGLLQRDGASAQLRTAGRFREDGSSGHLWLGADDIDLKQLLFGIDMDGYTAEQGHGKLAAWLDWYRGKVVGSTIRLDLDQLSVRHADGARAGVSSLHGMAGLRRTADGYNVRWAGDDGSLLALNLHQPAGQPIRVGVAARELQVAPLLPWLALKPDLGLPLAQWLGSGHPRGDLNRLALQWNQTDGVQAIDVAFTGLAIDPVGKLPGVNSLHGELRGDTEAFSLELPAQPATLQFPQGFRQPFALTNLSGTLAVWPDNGDWHIGVDALDFAGAGYAGDARGEIALPARGGAPFLDMYASLDHADLQAAKAYLPINALPPATVSWLDNALVEGSIDQAQVLVRGSLADWPFRHNEGRFEARAPVSGLVFDYGKGWPRGEGLDLVASFVNNGLSAEAAAGQVLGVKVDHAAAQIPDFADPVLDLSVQGSGSGASLMEFARKSPIGSAQAETLAKLNLGGSGAVDFHLALPLARPNEGQVTGTAQLKDADLTAPEWNLKLDKINGPLRFDGHGLQGGPLDVGFRGQPSKLQLAIAGGNADPNTTFSAQLTGNYQLAELLQDYPTLKWLVPLADGRSDFTIGFTIAHPAGSTALTQTLSVDSPLTGMTLNLPVPLKKSASESLPLQLTLGLPVSGSDLRLALGQVARGHFRLADGAQKPLAGTIALGSDMPNDLPAQGLRIRGHAEQLDITGWVQHVAASGSGDGPSLESLDISTAQAALFGYPFGAMQIKAKPQADAISVDVDAASMVGNFNIPTREMGKRGITARLQKLYWPKEASTPANANGRPNPSPPAGAAASGSSSPTVTAAPEAMPADNPANTGINPAALPPFHLWLADLRLDDARLGEARLETWPTAAGLHIEQLRAISSRVQITAGGDWDGSATDSHTHMKIDFAAADLGGMLSAFGFQGLVDGGKTSDRLEASWPGAPSALTLASMDGTLNVHVSNGRIPEVSSPGAGRLLGLASVAELPRRMTLDFGDVFGKGLAFDSMAGDFRLANGTATTDNFKIHSSAAEISITGRTDMRAKKFDQQIVVVPHAGNSLPIVGAVVGGPLGAAAGFAVQGLLGHGLNKAVGARYKITGSWDKPIMTLIEKHTSPALPPAVVAPMPVNASKNVEPASAQSIGY